jgi:predicted nuclease of predicted toxin-antitoxin system
LRLLVDECLSPRIALRLNATGRHDAVHPLHVGRRAEPDHRVVAWSLEEDRVIVTENGRDFRRLLGRLDVHPGLIVLPALKREATWSLLRAAIAYLEERGEPMNVMVNNVLEVGADGRLRLDGLSAGP